jgi:hypothetical protein
LHNVYYIRHLRTTDTGKAAARRGGFPFFLRFLRAPFNLAGAEAV